MEGAARKKRERKGRPERIRYAFLDDATGSTPLSLPARRMWPVGLLFLVFFAIFAGIGATSVFKMRSIEVRGVFDLMFVLFEGFWLLGWSVGVLILGLLTVLFLFYGESARLHAGRLVHVPRLGPLRIIIEYELAKIRNLRLESAGGEDRVRLRFDYGGGRCRLGDAMPRAEAERLRETLAGAMPAGTPAGAEAEERSPAPEAPAGARTGAPDRPLPHPAGAGRAPAGLQASTLALVLANLLPLAGVVLYGWDVARVVVLFWAESAIIGLYTVARIIVVGKLGALFTVPFFVGHFGAFMAIHFLFIYGLLVRGLDARGAEPPAAEALLAIFLPVWPALAALAVSHGVSFVVNFLGRREYVGESMQRLMTAPYRRIIVMQVALIFGGWVVLALSSPLALLTLLVVLKIALDVRTHRREHAAVA